MEIKLPKLVGGWEQKEDFQFYKTLIDEFRRFKSSISSAPTGVPKNFFEQFEFYENGATRRLYVYVGSSWRYCSLT